MTGSSSDHPSERVHRTKVALAGAVAVVATQTIAQEEVPAGRDVVHQRR
jgi:hypothetical protein